MIPVSDSFDREPADSEPFHISRRDWFKTVGIVTAGLGAAAAAKHDKLLPFLNPNPQIVPGVTTWYATTCRECPAGCGMLVATREGRAIKCEGNPAHPINAGRLCARGQAALQGLYDPDRIRTPLRRDGRGRFTPASWQEALGEIGAQLAAAKGTGRVAVISDLQAGSLDELIRQWLKQFGSDRHLMYEPLNYEALRRANGHLCGETVVPSYRLDKSDYILSLGADFLDTWISPVQFAREFASLREPGQGRRARFVYAGPRLSMTAANADLYLPLPPGEVGIFGLAVLWAIISAKRGYWSTLVPIMAEQERAEQAYSLMQSRGLGHEVQRVADDFAQAKAPLAIASGPADASPAACAAGVAAGMLTADRLSRTVDFATPHALSTTAMRVETTAFVSALSAGEVDVLVIIGGDPLYSLPPSTRFAEALRSVKSVVHVTPFANETTQIAHWVLPADTPLESWGDYSPQPGVEGLVQPVMGALYDTRAPGDALLNLFGAAGLRIRDTFEAESYYEFLRLRWLDKHRASGVGGAFDDFWTDCLQRGGRYTPRPEPSPPHVYPSAVALTLEARARPIEKHEVPEGQFALLPYPSASLYDGRGANKRWLQELPDPITKVAWASWIEVEPTDAQRLGIQQGDVLQLDGEHGSVRAPALVYPGLAPGTVAVPLGQGHAAYGRYAKGIGANAFQLAGDTGVRLTRLQATDILPCPDGSTSQEGREMARTIALNASSTQGEEGFSLPLPESYTLASDVNPPHSYPEHRWAMVIDLARCTGCSACVTACYAENNIGVVGKKTFSQRRDMSWMRIDRYFDWTNEAPDGQAGRGQPSARVIFQPMLCQHCDEAPCESVCPVFASSHSDEGLNMQIYNRCVGTRYCSNNCPYKVRRFNWFDYEWPEPLNWQANPEVTIRCRGVMEKCTFCIQRIRAAEWQAKRENRPVRDGEIIPACAQTCPTGAIIFGDLMDETSRVAQLIRHDPRRYQVFPDLNTKPGVVYLKRIVSEA